MRSIGIGLLLGLVSNPAFADWQYTNWNMTPEQVVVASHRQSHLVNGRPGDRVASADLRAVGTYSAAEIAFTSQFFFDTANRLRVVKLLPKNMAECDKFKEKIEGIYGTSPPANRTRMYNLSGEFWLDHKMNMKVQFASLDSECWVTYSPLEVTGANGL